MLALLKYSIILIWDKIKELNKVFPDKTVAVTKTTGLKTSNTYNLYWKSCRSILNNPKTHSSPMNTYGKHHRGVDKENGCTISLLDLIDEDKTRTGPFTKILGVLLSQISN